MKLVKQKLQEGIERRGFELIQTLSSDIDQLPWWLAEVWMIKHPKLFQGQKHYLHFLIDKLAEGNIKIVEIISLQASKMENYLDLRDQIAFLEMRKGNFDEKLDKFWIEFEKQQTKHGLSANHQ